jgi:hypothetical protein
MTGLKWLLHDTKTILNQISKVRLYVIVRLYSNSSSAELESLNITSFKILKKLKKNQPQVEDGTISLLVGDVRSKNGISYMLPGNHLTVTNQQNMRVFDLP